MVSGMHHKLCTVNEVLQTLVPCIVFCKVFKTMSRKPLASMACGTVNVVEAFDHCDFLINMLLEPPTPTSISAYKRPSLLVLSSRNSRSKMLKMKTGITCNMVS
jgi:hypothetical protein